MIALKSRSPQIAAAARIACINWVASLQFWLVLEGASLTVAYILTDLVTAAVLFRMARGRWFPVPLCFLHGVLVIYHIGMLFNAGGLYWEQFVLNRAFDLELAYIAACALFRIAVTARDKHATRA